MKTSKICLVLAVLFLCSIFSTGAFAAVANDEVTSQKIKEADGTSGQNTNSGSGVKTGHIQDGAVTDAKISGVISGAKIGTHTHSQSQVTGLEAALAGKSDVTHNHDALYQQKYGKVAVVAQTGGDYIDPVAAMNNLATWCGTPSATNPCLLKIMPGVYTLGNTLMIASYVDVEGSGANSTKIVGTVRYEHTNNNELRMLTVESAGTAIEISSSSSLRIRDASIVGVYRGIDMAYSGNVTLSHVDISVSSATGQEPAGISSFYPYGDVLIEDCMISASGSQTVASWGFRGSSYYGGGSGNLFIKNSKITATPVGFAVYAESYDIFVNGSEIKAPASLFYGSRSTSIANTMLDGPSPTGAKCFGAYDGNYNPVVCQ